MPLTLLRVTLSVAGLAVFCGGILWAPRRPASPTDAPSRPGPAARTDPAESQRLASLSQAAFLGGRWQEALGPTLDLHEAFPANHVYLDRLAHIYGELGRPDEEARFWEKFFTVAPIPAEACPNVGKAYWKEGASRKAVDAFERCLALDPTDTDSIYHLAWAYEHTEEIARAEALYERGHSLAPGYDDITLGLARVHLREGRVRPAREAAQTILARTPDNVDALLVLGLALVREGRHDQARRTFERGVRLMDSYVDFHLALGRLAESEGRLDEALRRYEHALEREPGNAEALEARTRLASKAG